MNTTTVVKKEINNKVVKLGDQHVFIKRIENGRIKVIKAEAKLSLKKKEIANCGGNNWMITSPGADTLNAIAGLHIALPEHVIHNGQKVNNPYIERHPTQKYVISGSARVLVVGYSPTLNMVGVVQSVSADLETFKLQDIASKAKKYKNFAVFGLRSNIPEIFKNKPTRFYITDGDGDKSDDVGYWVDVSHPEYRAVYDQLTQKRRFLMQTLQSIATRNAILKHPAIACKSVDPQHGKAVVPVYGVLHDHSIDELNKIALNIEEGRSGENVEVKSDIIDANYEDIVAEEEAEPELNVIQQTEQTESNNENNNQSGESTPEPKNQQALFDDDMKDLHEKGSQKLSDEDEEFKKYIEEAEEYLGEQKIKEILTSNFGRKDPLKIPKNKRKEVKNLIEAIANGGEN